MDKIKVERTIDTLSKLIEKIDDRKEFVATLRSKDEKNIIVSIDDFNLSYDLKDVASVTPYIEF